MNGKWRINTKMYAKTVKLANDTVADVWSHGMITPRMPHANWFRHVYREFNKVADKLAGIALRTGASNHKCDIPPIDVVRRLRGHFDGAFKEGRASCGWVIEACRTHGKYGKPVWNEIASASVHIGYCSVVNAELLGAVQLVKAIVSICKTGAVSFSMHGLVESNI